MVWYLIVLNVYPANIPLINFDDTKRVPAEVSVYVQLIFSEYFKAQSKELRTGLGKENPNFAFANNMHNVAYRKITDGDSLVITVNVGLHLMHLYKKHPYIQ